MAYWVRNNAQTGDINITLIKNMADTSVTFTIGAGLLGCFSDDAHEVEYAVGDDYNVKIVSTQTAALTISGLSASGEFL